ncbi:uncharacterized protein LOC132714552 [Ruditapes philippinarum]|uniref:uncharacterized protein LOC132714552 n=1 Tax=Ruditapes philippinarum TaxID=129788 RepID=UPI00295B894D|nr:uncharacterized protein LOC132714552 [Ruditapes philippinarum]
MTSFLTIVSMLLIVLPLAVLPIMCIISCCCSRKQRDLSLQRKIWDKFGNQFINNGVLLIFSGSKNNRPKLIIMRYNVFKCKDYLKSVIMEKYPQVGEPLAETYALSSIKRYVQEILPVLAEDFDSLEEAPYNRHNVKRGKICICQHLELVM